MVQVSASQRWAFVEGLENAQDFEVGSYIIYIYMLMVYILDCICKYSEQCLTVV